MDDGESINMMVDEYETIRLIDLEGFTQEECAAHMNIARTTVQGIYDAARKKLADSLVNGKMLWIEGGEYRLCDGMGPGCSGRGCHRRRCGRGHMDDMEEYCPRELAKLPIDPKLATACDKGMIELYEGAWFDNVADLLEADAGGKPQ